MIKTTTRDVSGTSFHGATVRATVNELRAILGEPTNVDNSGDEKVNFEWNTVLDDDSIFTVYDWKEGRELDLDEDVNWHIGAFNSFTSFEAQEQIVSLLKWNRLREIKL